MCPTTLLGLAQSKHIDLRYYSVRKEVIEGKIGIAHMGSEVQFVDIMAKPVPQDAKHSKYIL